jgi:hypothetical protein
MKLFPVFLTFTIILAIFTIIGIVVAIYSEQSGNGLCIFANNLADKPEKYFSLTNPDSYVLRAISNPGKLITIGSFDNTRIDELEQTYSTNNIKYNDNYYEIQSVYVDRYSYGYLLSATIGWFLLGIAAAIFAITRHLRRKTSSTGNLCRLF